MYVLCACAVRVCWACCAYVVCAVYAVNLVYIYVCVCCVCVCACIWTCCDVTAPFFLLIFLLLLLCPPHGLPFSDGHLDPGAATSTPFLPLCLIVMPHRYASSFRRFLTRLPAPRAVWHALYPCMHACCVPSYALYPVPMMRVAARDARCCPCLLDTAWLINSMRWLINSIDI